MMFSKYILKKTKSIIKQEKYHELEKMVTRLTDIVGIGLVLWNDSIVGCGGNHRAEPHNGIQRRP